MAAPKWFDYATYKTNKLAQLQQLDSSWTMAKMEDAFTKAGFTGTDGYYQHFQKYGHTEDVSPNKLFSAEYYYKAKALQFYTSEAGGSIAEETVQDKLDYYAQQVKGLINNAGMDAWTHYIKYGTAEGINPSNSFDTEAYMTAKLQALQAAEPSAGWTEETMNAAFKKAGLNALEHFMVYAGNGNANEVAEGIAADGTVPDAYVVPESEQIDDDASKSGTEFTLTAGTTVLTSNANVNATPAGQYLSSADDTIHAYTLLNAADTIQDPSTTDSDVLNVSVANAGTTANIANIETINLDFVESAGNGSFDMQTVTGVKAVNLTMTNDGAVTSVDATASAPVYGLVGGSKVATLNLVSPKGTSDAISVQVKDFNGGLTFDSADAGATTKILETLNLETAGTGASSLEIAVDGVNVTSIGDVKVTGSQDVTLVAKADGILSGAASAIAKIEKGDGATGKVNLLIQGVTDALMSLKDYDVDGLTLGATGANNNIAATFAVNDASSGLAVDLVNGGATSFTVNGNAAVTKGTSDALTINVGGAQTALGTLIDTGFENVTINQESTKAVTITTLTHTNNPAGTDVLAVTGESKGLTIAQADIDFDQLDATTFAAALKMTGATQTHLNSVKGGSGNDELVIGKLGAEANGGAGNDTITAAASVANMEMTGGAGDDIFVLTNATSGQALANVATANFVTVEDFGTGSDVLELLAAVNDVAASENDFSAITSSSSDSDIFAILAGTAAAAANDVAYYNVNGATYVWQASGTATLAAGDILVKLVGFDGDLKAGDDAGTVVADA